MKSTIVDNLRPEFEPVAVVWSDTLPADTFQFKEGKFGCVLYLFAHASRQGKVAGAAATPCSAPAAEGGMEDNRQAGQDMNCSECNRKVRKLDKKVGGWICIALGLMTGLRLDPDWSLRFAGSAYLWLIIFVVPGFMLLRAKP